MPRMSLKHQLVCNQCGKELRFENDILVEDAFEAKKEWGYFSKKDLTVDQFVLCELCYDKMIENFKIPIIRKEKTEV